MKLKAELGWRHVHMVGMGGAGMSAIAHLLTQADVQVSGSDSRESAALQALRDLGITASVGHRAAQIDGADVLVLSSAIPATNPEVVQAKAAGIPMIWRGEALAQIVKGYRSVAVSGTHGKTTTSGMIATVLEAAGLDPTYALGATLAGGQPGGFLGSGDVAVVEADEAYKSFLWLEPAISVVTNVDRDHVDHYGSWESLLSAFRIFMQSASESVVVCADDARAMELAAGLDAVTYGFAPQARFRAEGLTSGAWGSTFELVADQAPKVTVNLKVTGRHNAQNALGAAAACLQLGLPLDKVVEGLALFKGVSRRFEFRGRFEGADMVDDYAHHPAEIQATLTAARWGPWDRIVAVFQPHLYSRTQELWQEFGAALAQADLIIVTDVYGAREDPVPGITGKLIVESVCEHAPGRKVAYLPRLNDAAEYLREAVRPNDLILTLGAGDITTLPDRLSGVLT